MVCAVLVLLFLKLKYAFKYQFLLSSCSKLHFHVVPSSSIYHSHMKTEFASFGQIDHDPNSKFISDLPPMARFSLAWQVDNWKPGHSWKWPGHSQARPLLEVAIACSPGHSSALPGWCGLYIQGTQWDII